MTHNLRASERFPFLGQDSLQRLAAVGLVDEVHVVVLCKPPIGGVALHKARDGDEGEDHQVDAGKDLVHQRRLVHAEGQQTCRRERR